MKAGEIWNDKVDGSKVKIMGISDAYVFHPDGQGRSYIVAFQDIEGTSGNTMFARDFLIQYEKSYEVLQCR